MPAGKGVGGRSPPAGTEPWRGSPPDAHVDCEGGFEGFQQEIASMKVLFDASSDLEAVLVSVGVEHDSNESTTDQDDKGPNALEIFRQLSLLNGMKPLIQTLHDKLGIDRSAIWEELAENFDSISAVNMYDRAGAQEGV
jgi:hypothetical protein